MAFEDYDVGLAFARIEDELISSMMRNLKRHLREEEKEGFDWSQWQVEQLKYLNEYRRKNRKKFGPQFADINRKMKESIQEAYENGQKEEELRILEKLAENKKIQRRYANQHASIEAAGDAFFRPNEKKLEALMDATQNDMQKAEQAVLRRSNDQYRKIIFDAQVYANSGAGTVEKAIDMATKDFLSSGIDSIVYKNGARHTISDYADMYIRTAERRATLMGEGRKRQEWGESLVIVNKRGAMREGSYGTACPLCIPWLGKVLVDDVYSGGKPDGHHQLLSEAMEQGFLHPRCKDGVTTYFPGISTAPDPDATKKELKAAVDVEKEEARESYVERQVEKYERLAKYSLDPENKRKNEARVEKWRGLSSSGNNGKVEPHDPPEFIRKILDTEDRQKILSEYEKIIVDSPIENAIVITRDGELYHCRGTLNNVYPDVDLGEKLRGADMTHNHPKGSDNEYSFSFADIRMFSEWDLQTLRGVDHLFEYILDRNPRDIDNHILITEFDDYSSRHEEVISRAAMFGYGYRRKRRG